MPNLGKALFLTMIIILATLSTPNLKIVQVLAQQLPVAKFTYTPEVPLINETVIFNASESYDPDGTILSYEWNFGDGTPEVVTPEVTVTHAYSAVGNYTVTLNVTDNEGLTNSSSLVVTVNYYPQAIFTYYPESPLVGETVLFNASESKPNGGVIRQYYWDFGDGATANVTSDTVTHAYSAVGNYTVTLTVWDSYGLTNSSAKLIVVIKAPVARFTYSPSYPTVDQTVTFDASTSESDGGVILWYYWDFGDGATANVTSDTVTHAYSAVGNYTVTLLIKDDEGLSGTTSKILSVREYPIATFVYFPTLPYVNETVTFNASESTPRGGVIIDYSWSFGDGQTGSGVIVNHTYTTYGTYYVTLTVTDSEGLSDSVQKSIRIIIGPIANFTHFPVYPLVNQTILFNATSSYDPDGTLVAYTWNFGDGNITTVSQPLIYHAYAAADVYEVSLTVTDNDGLTAHTSKFIGVYTTVPTHDVAILEVATSAVRIAIGEIIMVNVTAKNEGDSYFETFDVSLYYNDILIGTQTVIDLVSNTTEILTFNWNTAGLTPGDYSITAVASKVLDEIDLSDNSKTVTVRIGIPAILKVEPPIFEAQHINKTFNVDITINNLGEYWKVIGVEFRLSYNETLLEVVNVTEGPFLKNFGDTFFMQKTEPATSLYPAHVLIGVVLLPPYPPQQFPRGSGVLATVTFKIIHQEKVMDPDTAPPLSCNLELFIMEHVITSPLVDVEKERVPCLLEQPCQYNIYPNNIADVNWDYYVGIDDIVYTAERFGADPTNLPERWDPACDMNGDNYIGIDDIVLIASNFGWTPTYDP
jgi:PKD repeat protein